MPRPSTSLSASTSPLVQGHGAHEIASAADLVKLGCFVFPRGIPVADISPKISPETIRAIASPRDPRIPAALRLQPGSDHRHGFQAHYALLLIDHYEIARVSPPGGCPCQIFTGRTSCNGIVMIEDVKLHCRRLFHPFGLDHCRIATTRSGERFLIAALYDGLFVAPQYAKGVAALMGLQIEVSEVSAWLPGRTLSVIIRRDPAGSIYRWLRDPPSIIDYFTSMNSSFERTVTTSLDALAKVPASTPRSVVADVLEDLKASADGFAAAQYELGALITKAVESVRRPAARAS